MNSEQPLPERKTRNLSRGRLSLPCARYFVTCRAFDVGLHLPVVAAGIVSAFDALQRDGDIRRLCSTIMPDHIHLLCELGERLTVSQMVGKFKTLSQRVGDVGAALAQTAVAASGAPTMGLTAGRLNAQTAAQGAVAGRWQRNFFEHRLRPGELANNYARYIFMNPYRAGLIGSRAVWPHWRFESTTDFNFLQMLDDGRFPPAAWFTNESDEQLLPIGVEGHH